MGNYEEKWFLLCSMSERGLQQFESDPTVGIQASTCNGLTHVWTPSYDWSIYRNPLSIMDHLKVLLGLFSFPFCYSIPQWFIAKCKLHHHLFYRRSANLSAIYSHWPECTTTLTLCLMKEIQICGFGRLKLSVSYWAPLTYTWSIMCNCSVLFEARDEWFAGTRLWNFKSRMS